MTTRTDQKKFAKLSKKLQIMVFQDGLSSRNFEVPLAWFSRLGWILGGSLLATALSGALAIHVWRQSHDAQPERLKELELQIQALEKRALEKPATAPVAATPVAAVQTIPTQPIPTVTVTVTPVAAPPPPAAPAAPVLRGQFGQSGMRPLAFAAFPATVTGEIPWVARPSVPIEISPPQLQWQGRKLRVRFDIRFVGPEGKSQQGRILIVARGPETLITYPSGALSPVGSGALFDPEQGEYFSVSRFRETRIELPSVDSPIRTVEVFLIGTDSIDEENKILIHETLTAPPMGGATRAATPEDS